MAYRLKPNRSVMTEVRRIGEKQLTLAIADLRAVGDPRSDDDVHEARRRVKKVRALIRLVRPALGEPYYSSNRRLRLAARMLAPIADGEAIVDTVARVGARYPRQLSRHAVASVHAALVNRERQLDRKAKRDRVLRRVGAILRVERGRVRAWRLNAHGFRAIAPGLEHSARRLRRAAARAAAEPTVEHYHAWRRRAKDLWLQVRLLEGRCGNSLAADERQLEALDGCLGEHHNIVLLEHLLIGEPLASRQQTARCLRVLRRYRSSLRRRALTLRRALEEEKPRQFVRRVKRRWRGAESGARGARVSRRWLRAA